MLIRPPFAGWFSILLGLTACRDSQVAAYRIPKEQDNPPPAAAPAGMTGPAVAVSVGSELEWTVPADWKAKPGSAMRKGSYAIGEGETPGAELAITAFPGNVGGDLANVNRWRGQLALPPLGEAELGAALTPLSVNGLTMQVIDLTGGSADHPLRMLGAIVPHAGATWFFKLTGPDAVVAKARPAYLEFLKTVKASVAPAAPGPNPAAAAPPPAEMAGPPVIRAEGPGLKWTVPARWQPKPAGSMRKATFEIAGANGATAELAVTAFPGDVGGELANVNRWRGQLSLPPIAAGELTGAVQRLTVHGLPVAIVDVTGGAQQLLGAMVPYGGSTWFFKLTGPADLVAAEKPAFLAFVQSLSAP